MEKDHPHLTLVDQSRDVSRDGEFLPLPFYPWDERPPSLPLDPDETATAIHLANGDLPAASSLLKVPLHKVIRQIAHHPRLARVLNEALALATHRAASEYIRALDSPNDRRREWAATKILASRAAQSHPFSPAPVAPSAAASLTLSDPNGRGRVLTFRWRTDADDAPNEPVTIEHDREPDPHP